MIQNKINFNNKNITILSVCLLISILIISFCNVPEDYSRDNPYDPNYKDKDIGKPEATISLPSDNAIVSPIFTISGTAKDDVGVKEVFVMISIDSSKKTEYIKAEGTDNWKIKSSDLYNETLSLGIHTISIKVTDNYGNEVSYDNIRSITISNVGSKLTVSSTPNNKFTPSMSYNGNGYYGITYTEATSETTTKLMFNLVDSNGYPSSEIEIDKKNQNQINPKIINNNGNFSIVWQDYRNNATNSDIYFTNIELTTDSTNNTVSDFNASASVAVTKNTAYKQVSPSLTLLNDEIYIAWEDNRNGNSDIYLNTIKSGKPQSEIQITNDSNEQNKVQITSGTNTVGVVYADNRNSNEDIYFRIVNSNKTLVNEIQITNDSNIQTNPEITYGDKSYMIIWEDYRNTNADIYFSLVKDDGSVLISNYAITDHSLEQKQPVAFFDGKNFGIIWKDNRNGGDDIYLTTVNINGTNVKIGNENQITDKNLENESNCNDLTRCLVWGDSFYAIAWQGYATLGGECKYSDIFYNWYWYSK